jgi:hypothetical protein
MTGKPLPANLILTDEALAAATAAIGGDRNTARAALTAALPLISAEIYDRAAGLCRSLNGQASPTARRLAWVADELRNRAAEPPVTP